MPSNKKQRPKDTHVPKVSIAPPGFVKIKAWSYRAPKG